MKYLFKLLKIAPVVVLIVLTSFTSPALAQEKLTKSGYVTIEGSSIGFLIGFRWGRGTLTLNDGTKVHFTFKGVKALDTGAAVVKARGPVYNLKNLIDFEGTYTGFGGGATIYKDLAGFMSVRNGAGVIVSLKPDNTGIRLSFPGPGGAEVTFSR